MDLKKPIKLKSEYVKTIWAGSRLKRIRKLEEKTGIAREVSGYKGVESIIATGEYMDRPITELIEDYPEIIGNLDTNQLVRVAYIDADEDLSIQVHLNKELAKEISDYEKTETWYILEAEENAYVTAGTTLENKEDIRKYSLDGTIEDYLIRIPVKVGDVVHIPAGLIHACGKNLLAIEIGSYGGVTYRIYDYGRDRELHLDKGLIATDPMLRASKHSYPLENRNKTEIHNCINHYIYGFDILDVLDEYTIDNDHGYKIITCVYNECNLIINNENYLLNYTDTLFVPATVDKIKLEGDCRIIISKAIS